MGGTGGTMYTILYFVAIIAIFYFLLIRPQKKKDKQQRDMIATLKKGDKIITIGGFHAKVVSSKNHVITVTIGEHRVKLEDWAVKSVVSTDEKATDAVDAEVEETEETQE